MESSKLYDIDLENEQSLDMEEKLLNLNVDSVVQSIIDKFIERSKMGKKKYGKDLDRDDLSILEWIEHAQEEHMDAILYLEKLKKECILNGMPQLRHVEKNTEICIIL